MKDRTCFVTVGATAPFHELIEACTSYKFLESLIAQGYSQIIIQHGNRDKDLSSLMKNLELAPNSNSRSRISIDGFDFSPDGLHMELKAAKGHVGEREGVVISHAGSGSIMDALRMDVPLIVVPNPSLLDNHQVELAEELARQGYVVHGQVGDLSAALEKSEALPKKRSKWPLRDPDSDLSGRGMAGLMDDEMGFYD